MKTDVHKNRNKTFVFWPKFLIFRGVPWLKKIIGFARFSCPSFSLNVSHSVQFSFPDDEPVSDSDGSVVMGNLDADKKLLGDLKALQKVCPMSRTLGSEAVSRHHNAGKCNTVSMRNQRLLKVQMAVMHNKVWHSKMCQSCCGSMTFSTVI